MKVMAYPPPGDHEATKRARMVLPSRNRGPDRWRALANHCKLGSFLHRRRCGGSSAIRVAGQLLDRTRGREIPSVAMRAASEFAPSMRPSAQDGSKFFESKSRQRSTG